MKKKILLLFITLAMLFTSITSCQYVRWEKAVYNYRKDLVKAFNSEDINELTKLFTPSVTSSPDFETKAATLLSMLPPEVICLTDGALGTGYGADYAQTDFTVSANGKHYDIGILIHFKNPDDKKEIGILSLYITDKDNGIDHYKGGGYHMEDWVRGINFDL